MDAKVTPEESKRGSAITAGALKWLLVNIVFLLILGASLFLAAGRMDWRLGWIFLGVITAGQTATTLMLLATNPTLLGERAWMQKGSKFWDKVIVSLGEAGWIAIVIVAGLDRRFGWSPHLRPAFPVAGQVLIVLGFGIFLWAMTSNRFFSSFVRIQTDRGHRVATGGPYRYVRHPGYVGAVLTYLASPLALDSLWTFIPAALMIGLFVFRTVLEDRTLQAELTGYAAYARQVRFRLVPGVW